MLFAVNTTGMTATNLFEVGTVFVPVSDQERSLSFYVEKLGFEKRSDFVYGGDHRWIEVCPPGSTNSISLVPPSEGRSVGGDEAYCAFATTDIQADHKTLKDNGVEVEAIASEGSSRTGLISLASAVHNPVPAQFFFRDQDRNRFLVVQP